jgi:serine/threonine protein kinase
MSLYSAGDLFDYLAANGAMPEPAAVTLMLCLLSALTHLHRLGVVHRDVKAENILCLGDDGHSLWPPLCIFLDFRSKTIEDDIFQLSALLGTEWLEYLESEYLLTSM